MIPVEMIKHLKKKLPMHSELRRFNSSLMMLMRNCMQLDKNLTQQINAGRCFMETSRLHIRCRPQVYIYASSSSSSSIHSQCTAVIFHQQLAAVPLKLK